MTAKSSRFTQEFLERKRRQLSTLREQLRRASDTDRTDQAEVLGASLEQAHEYEDDAQKLAMFETDDNLISRDEERLARVERALRKLDEGTYGFSDASGKPIPDARLEATPEAINTLEEQAAAERERP
jgi:RNA polymerase-binding transcription factor